MTALEALARAEAKVAYDSARRRHEREALIAHTEHRPLMAHREMATASRLAKYAASELVVIRSIPDDHENREGQWP